MWIKASTSGSTNCVQVWRKSCHANNTCVEISDTENSIYIRDSKNKHMPYIKTNKSFIAAVKAR